MKGLPQSLVIVISNLWKLFSPGQTWIPIEIQDLWGQIIASAVFQLSELETRSQARL